jgi:hypothetical protein
MARIEGEIDIKFEGIDLTVSGIYDTESWEFVEYGQIQHSGDDMRAILDDIAEDEIYAQADKEYRSYLEHQYDNDCAESSPS